MTKKCINCKKEITSKSIRCIGCYRSWKSKQMKKNNIAKNPKIRKKLSLKMQGEYGNKNRNWKGGEIFQKGYKLIYSPNHPSKDSKGYVPEHRLIMEKKLGRFLGKEEVVHHKDRNSKNNLLNNLELLTKGSHRSIHQKSKKSIRDKKGKFKGWEHE